MRKQLLTLFVLVAVSFSVIGCGDPKVTGKVKFSDGSPLPVGMVMFQSGNFLGSGTLNSDGTYTAGKLKDGDGIPPGTYEVFLSGTNQIVAGTGENSATEAGKIPNKFKLAATTQLVNPKYLTPTTSGLTVTVKGDTVYDITVEKP
ncbi:MAG: hypothetical protein ACRC46_11480 [Thermoguttaceae bacterium]